MTLRQRLSREMKGKVEFRDALKGALRVSGSPEVRILRSLVLLKCWSSSQEFAPGSSLVRWVRQVTCLTFSSDVPEDRPRGRDDAAHFLAQGPLRLWCLTRVRAGPSLPLRGSHL